MPREYPDHFVRRLEILWGHGFMSPGGPEEVGEILSGLEVSGKTVLDIGSGLGGPALVIVGDLNAAAVVAADVDERLLERTVENAMAVGLDANLHSVVIVPGALPFPRDQFDIVFSKEAFLHVEDKAVLFGEILRVLKPGGVLAVSDWLSGENTASTPEWAAYQRLAYDVSIPVTASKYVTLLHRAGFTSITTRDRNAWYADLSRQQLAQIEGPLRQRLIAASNEDIFADWLAMRRAQTAAVAAGALRPTHLRAYKPQVQRDETSPSKGSKS